MLITGRLSEGYSRFRGEVDWAGTGDGTGSSAVESHSDPLLRAIDMLCWLLTVIPCCLKQSLYAEQAAALRRLS